MGRNVLNIPSGVPFLSTFVDALLSGQVIKCIGPSAPPLNLARTTIYVPTQRAARTLAMEFMRKSATQAVLLPRIQPLGTLDDTEDLTEFSDDAGTFGDEVALAIGDIERRLILAQLILRWARSLSYAIVSIDPDGAPQLDMRENILVSPSSANAIALAKELGALIDELIIENIEPTSIDQVVDASFDKYWSITTRFLRIALREWPAILKQRGFVDRVRRSMAVLTLRTEQIENADGGDPVIALGSTGSNPATATLIDAISRMTHGAVILPGLDRILDDATWLRIGETGEQYDEPTHTHPQYNLKRLLKKLNIDRDVVRDIGAPSRRLSARCALAAHALRPADTTEQWREYRAKESDLFVSSLEGVTLIEAPDERLEALSLALFMRQALETPRRTAVLITPDRTIARRVRAELARFDIDIEDSDGEPLSTTPIGTLARLLVSIGSVGPSGTDIATLLAHPLVTLNFSRDRIAALAPLIEIVVLRRTDRSGARRVEWGGLARELVMENKTHHALNSFAASDYHFIADFFEQLDVALKPMTTLSRDAMLTARIEALRNSIRSVATLRECGDPLTSSRGLKEFAALLEQLLIADAPMDFDDGGFASFLSSLLSEIRIREPSNTYPRLKILGPLEARLIDADLILLAGLDEGVWPPQTNAGPFLNRSMRYALGLSPLERRIGQSAHDFVMAFGSPEVVLSRAVKRGGSPCVASRFVARLGALAGEAYSNCKARGDAMLSIAHALDQPRSIKSCERPQPRPPVELRPAQLSVTRIEILRRDPYSIYAERILRLTPLESLGSKSGAREAGTAIHEALAEFVLTHPCGALPENARDTLLAIAKRKLANFMNNSGFLAFKWPRIEMGLDHALAFEKSRRTQDVEIFIEEHGEWRVQLFDQTTFLLTANADRIEVDPAGTAWVYDFKTGAPPSNSQVLAGFSPQLTLEAAMIESGAFLKVGKRRTHGGAYVHIGGNGDGAPLWIKSKEVCFGDLVAEHRAQLLKMLDQFRDPRRSYPSRPYVAFISRHGDYDHLARVKEWSRNGGESSE